MASLGARMRPWPLGWAVRFAMALGAGSAEARAFVSGVACLRPNGTWALTQ